MKMISPYYFCLDCDSVMDDTESLCFHPEAHSELDGNPVEWVGERRCIYCNSDNLEEAEYCDECGELFPRSMLDENSLCENCRQKYQEENEE